MVDYHDSSQLNLWHFESIEELDTCRAYTNWKARQYLYDREMNNNNNATEQLPVSHYCCIKEEREKIIQDGKNNKDYATLGPYETPDGNNTYLNSIEESVLVSFYVSKLPNLIGPNAQIRRLRRESKVLATAATLYRRFFLSNSVLLYDPKAIMVAAAFLASKTEDATADIRFLEEGTVTMNAAVTQQEIVINEIALLSGIHFYLLCFHPYKAVVALTEDLRTFFKTATGKKQLLQDGQEITGQDLKPLYDTARFILDDIIISDLIFLSSPGQIGLASLMVAQQQINSNNNDNSTNTNLPKFDFMEYLKCRFPHEKDAMEQWMPITLQQLTQHIQELKDGKHGCCKNDNDTLIELKAIHKKLKKVRAWGQQSNKKSSSGGGGTKKKKRKNNNDNNNNENANTESSNKKSKTE